MSLTATGVTALASYFPARRAGSVDGRGCRAFYNFNTLDVVHVKAGKPASTGVGELVADRDAVDNVDGSSADAGSMGR